MRHRAVLILTAAGLAVGTFVTAAPSLVASAQVTISGSSRQLTTGPANKFDPAISGNIVAYTDMTSGNANITYYDLTTGTEHPVTSSTFDQNLADVSGNTIVWVDHSAATGGHVRGFTIGGSQFDISVGPFDQTEPSIAGSLVAWQDNRNGNYDIHAKDLVTGVEKGLTANPSANSATPNVSGDMVAYSAQDSVSTQIFVTSFSTLVTRQLTTIGNSAFPDISGNRVTYQGTRPAGDQDIFVFDLTTSTETRISLPGIQRNPHISGDWVSFEDVTSTGISSIKLYFIPTGQVFTAVQASSLADSAFLNDIDGTNVAYTSNAGGNDNIYLFSFTVTPEGPSLSDLSNLVSQLQMAGCIDNSGVTNALLAKLAAAQSAVTAGDIKTAINTLTAFINQVQAQSGKHILASCPGFTNPAATLIADAQSIINSLSASATPNPITGSVATANGSGVSGATVSLIDPSTPTPTTLATATTDVTGFYFFATTGLLTSGATYTVAVTGLPSGFSNSSPAGETFTWAGSTMALSPFTLS